MDTPKDEISVTILGSGTCVPSLERSSCSVLVEIGNSKVLLDSGPGTMRRLLEAGKNIFDVSLICYSHLHPDHTSELVPFLFASKYPEKTRRQTPLTIMAGKGFLNFYKGLKAAYGDWIELGPDLLNIVEVDNAGRDFFSFDNFTVESVPVEHNKESVAFRIIGCNGKSIVYSGDTDFSENLVALSEDTDLLICESAFPDELKVQGHLTPSLAGEIATRANVRKLVLTHFYPECDKVDIAKQCRKTYTNFLILAYDLMKLTV